MTRRPEPITPRIDFLDRSFRPTPEDFEPGPDERLLSGHLYEVLLPARMGTTRVLATDSGVVDEKGDAYRIPEVGVAITLIGIPVAATP
jgi:hypothetical protein